MALDRDLGVAVVRALRAVGEGPARGWEMTAATGVRGLRLVGEAGPFREFLLTERHPAAYEVLDRNCRDRPTARAELRDAGELPPGRPFDYVDLDPYGSPLPFLATALGSVSSGGTVAVTATDLMVLAGAQPAVCRRLYGAEPVRGRLGPEGGLRILLSAMASEARRAGRRIDPRLAYVRDHHVRAYVTVRTDGDLPDPIGRIDPAWWDGPALGQGGPFGPLWLGPLFDRAFVAHLEVPATAEHPGKLAALLERFRDESGVDRPFYFEANELARAARLERPPGMRDLGEALRRSGYRWARTHARPSGFRTDAPRAEVEAIARGLAAQSQKARVRA